MNPSERAVYTAPVNLECGINHGMGQKKAEEGKSNLYLHRFYYMV